MKVAIIGGGAAGLMAAASLLKENPQTEIFLLDRNDALGKKVVISGGGRCNVTTGIADINIVLSKYPRGAKFLTSAMHQFPPRAVYEWFEAQRVPLKNQIDDRVFPVSNDGHDIVHVFEKLFRKTSVKVMLETTVDAITKTDEGFSITLRHHPEPLIVDKVILTTGGQAYRQTGSTGDGYAFATALGHTITPLAPSLNSFTTLEKWPSQVSGLSFSKVKITALRNKKPNFTGPILFTHQGVSGPAVFALSSLVAFEKYDQKQPLNITIDLFPDISIDNLRADFEAKMKLNAKKKLANALDIFLPKSLADELGAIVEISDAKNAGDLSKKEINQIIGWVKAIPLTVVGRGAGDEFVTAGGVSLSEVNPSTMESKICPGLFFAGEILDIDGFTGGFNLQASWATGRLAGINAAKTLSE